MNIPKLLRQIRGLIDKAERGAIGDVETWHQQGIACIRLVYDDEAKETSFAEIRFFAFHGMLLDNGPTEAQHAQAEREGIADAVSQLEGAKTYLQMQQPDDLAEPSVDLAGLHPWFAPAAASLWDAGHPRKAVEEAARSVELQLKIKLGWESSGADLVTQGFSKEPPVEGKPRLRFTDYEEDTTSWTNAHEGAMFFGRGCFMRIRNLYQHTQEPNEAEALEALAAFSLLARWVDQAEVVVYEDSAT